MEDELYAWEQYHEIKVQHCFNDLYTKMPPIEWYDLQQLMTRQDISIRLGPILPSIRNKASADAFYAAYLEFRHTNLLTLWIRQCMRWKQEWSALPGLLLKAHLAIPPGNQDPPDIPDLVALLEDMGKAALLEQLTQALQAQENLLRELPLLRSAVDERIESQKQLLNKEYQACAAYVLDNSRDMYRFYSATSKTGLKPLEEIIPLLDQGHLHPPPNALELLSRYKEALALTIVYKKLTSLL